MNKKHLFLFLGSRFISSLGDQFLLFAVPLVIYQFTHSIAMSGLAFFIEWLPRIISLPIAGALSDKYGGRKIYLTADIVRSLTCLIAFTILYFIPDTTFWTVCLMMSLCAFFYAQSFIALEATIPAMIEMENMHKAQSLIQAVEQSTFILGPLLASLLVLLMPVRNIIFIAGFIFFSSFFANLPIATIYFSKTAASHQKKYWPGYVSRTETLFFKKNIDLPDDIDHCD